MKNKLNLILIVFISCMLVIFTGADDTDTADVNYHVDSSYTWQIHSTIDFGSNAGVGTTVNRTAQIGQDNLGVKVTENIIPDGATLKIDIDDSQTFVLTNNTATLNYTVAKTSGGTAMTAGENVLSLEAGVNEGSQALYFSLNTGSSNSEIAGTYQGTITYNAYIDAPNVPSINGFITFSSDSPFTVQLSKYWQGTIEYSTDKENWTEYITENSVVNSNSNNELYFRGSDNTYFYTVEYTQSGIRYNQLNFKLNGSNISCSGNIENLLDYEEVAAGNHPTTADYTFAGIFKNCTNLVSVADLEFPTVLTSTASCSSMFERCTDLVYAPTTLPASSLTTDCYSSMFEGCTSLESTPELPATELAYGCYNNMFGGCTSLTTAPALRATELADTCYRYMFNGCTSLVNIPALPATNLPTSCYNSMFMDCSSIKLSKVANDTYTIPYRIPSSGSGSAVQGATNYMCSNTGGTYKGYLDVNTTYYLASTNGIVE